MRANPLDPELQAALDALGIVPADFTDELLATARTAVPPEPVVPAGVDRTEIADGAAVYTLLRPAGATEPLQAVCWIHGGGYILGSRTGDLEMLSGLVLELGIAAASVEYRLAPDTPYPGPLDDCEAAFRHLVAHAAELGLDPARIGIAGRSAGGGLAAALALRVRNASIFSWLDYPMIDDRQATPSSRLEGLQVWSSPSNTFGWKAYLGDLYGGEVPADAAAAHATDAELAGLPPTYICVGTQDGFRDEDIAFALRLNQAGVECELHVYPGTPHGYQLLGDSAVFRSSHQATLNWLRRQFDLKETS